MTDVSTERLAPLALLVARPRAMALLGVLITAWSPIFIRLAAVSPPTAAVFRCVYAIPILLALAIAEGRRHGARPLRDRAWAAIAGGALAIDLVLWNYAIEGVGAGLATVLSNLQVAVLPLLAWIVLRERPSRRLFATLPLMLVGVLLISGVLEAHAYGADPVKGVIFGAAMGLSYTAFILALRVGGHDPRRPAGPLFDATFAGAAVALLIGVCVGDLDVVPSWPAHGWLLLLALSAQVVGWLLIGASLPRMPAALMSILLALQPIGAVMLGALILAESPSQLQVIGVAAILVGVVVGARRPAGTLDTEVR